MKHYTVC